MVRYEESADYSSDGSGPSQDETDGDDIVETGSSPQASQTNGAEEQTHVA